MGIRTVPRLQALQNLRRRVEHELDSARRRDARAEVTRLRALVDRLDAEIKAETPAPAPRPVRAEPTLALMDTLGVTAHDVKVWAVAAGLIPAVVRGRIKHALVEAYAAANHPTTAPTEQEPAAP